LQLFEDCLVKILGRKLYLIPFSEIPVHTYSGPNNACAKKSLEENKKKQCETAINVFQNQTVSYNTYWPRELQRHYTYIIFSTQ